MKGALAIELEPVEETLALMREVAVRRGDNEPVRFARPAVPKNSSKVA